MPSAGALRDLLRFERRAPDEFGEPTGAWAPQFEAWAQVIPLRGGETVLAGRLANTGTFNVTVRRTPETLAVTTAWRCVDVETGALYDLKDVTLDNRAPMRGFLLFLAQSGTADGGERTEAGP